MTNSIDVRLFLLKMVSKLFCIAAGSNAFTKVVNAYNFETAERFHGGSLKPDHVKKIVVYQQLWRIIHKKKPAASLPAVSQKIVFDAVDIAWDILGAYEEAAKKVDEMPRPRRFSTVEITYIEVLGTRVNTFGAFTTTHQVSTSLLHWSRWNLREGKSITVWNGRESERCSSPVVAVSDIFMSPGQISNQYSTVALYSIFTSARMTVACADTQSLLKVRPFMDYSLTFAKKYI